MKPQINPVEVLLAEDREMDIDLVRTSFRKLKIANHLTVVKDGLELMSYLRREKPHELAIRPVLILLDLNMPRKNGREALKEIKEDPNLRRIPVVVMTSSDAEEDIIRSYDLHANAYIRKPIEITELHKVISQIDSFWLTLVTLPPG